MENASEALMMAFGVLIFVLALTVAINSFGQAREVSDLVIYTSDETNYYTYEVATGGTSQNRTVGLETIIPTLYKYYKENYTVLFRQGKRNKDSREITETEPLTIYNTPSRYKSMIGVLLWGQKNPDTGESTYDELMKYKYTPYYSKSWFTAGNKKIFSFDLDEETLRNEPWAGNPQKSKENIDRFLYGEIYKNPSNNEDYIDYGSVAQRGDFGTSGGFIQKYLSDISLGYEYVETIGEYEQKKAKDFIETIDDFKDLNKEWEDTKDGRSVNKNKKRIIIFTRVKKLD